MSTGCPESHAWGVMCHGGCGLPAGAESQRSIVYFFLSDYMPDCLYTYRISYSIVRAYLFLPVCIWYS